MPMNEKLSPPPYFPLQAALFEAGLAVVAIVLGSIFDQSPCRTVQWTGTGLVLGVLAVLPLMGMLFSWRQLSWRPAQSVWRVLEEVVVPLFRKCNWIEIALISILAGIGEELLFRGLLQTGVAEWSGDFLPHTPAGAMAGDWLAVVLVAIIFGALHAVNTAYAVLAAIIGIYLGSLFWATGNLAVPMVAHALYDFLALVYILHRTPHARPKE